MVSVTATENRGISKEGMPGLTPSAAPAGRVVGSGVPHWYSTYDLLKRFTWTICRIVCGGVDLDNSYHTKGCNALCSVGRSKRLA